MRKGCEAAVTAVELAFVVALSRERAPFLRRVGRVRRERLDGRPFYRFSLDGRPCALVECGIGRERAAAAATAIIALTRPRVVVGFGVSGAAVPGCGIGDIVAVESVRAIENGLFVALPAPAPWPDEAFAAVERTAAHRGVRAHRATLVTVDGSDDDANLVRDFDRAFLDMETAALARAANEHALPLFVLRSVSDTPEEPLPFTIADFLDSRQRLRTGRLLAAVMRRPGGIAQLVRLARTMHRATELLAEAVVAAVGALREADEPHAP